MASSGTMIARMLPTAKAVPPAASAARAEVLPTMRKLGAARYVPPPFQGCDIRVCLGRGYDLIQQAASATRRFDGAY